MRPSFCHIDAVLDDNDLLAKQLSTTEGKKKVNPILFKKLDSERMVQICELLYVFKRASKEEEEWLTLDVNGLRSGEEHGSQVYQPWEDWGWDRVCQESQLSAQR